MLEAVQILYAADRQEVLPPETVNINGSDWNLQGLANDFSNPDWNWCSSQNPMSIMEMINRDKSDAEKEMQEGIAREEARQERIRILNAERAEEIDRRCAIINAAHKAKYAALLKAMRSADTSSCPPRGLSLPSNSVDSVWGLR